MQITFSQLKKLPVETQSGVYLGKVVDAILSVEDNSIFQYPRRSSPGIFLFIGSGILMLISIGVFVFLRSKKSRRVAEPLVYNLA